MHRLTALAILTVCLAACHDATEPGAPPPGASADSLRVADGTLECDACDRVTFALAGPGVTRFGSGAFVRVRAAGRDTIALVTLRRVTRADGPMLEGEAIFTGAVGAGIYDLELVTPPGAASREQRVLRGVLHVSHGRTSSPAGEPTPPPSPPDSTMPPAPAPEHGVLHVTVSASGVNVPDSIVLLARSDVRGEWAVLAAVGVATPWPLPAGTYRVAPLDLPSNCTVTTPPDDVTVVARDTVGLAIAVACLPPARIRVTVVATGVDVPRPLYVLCDGGACGALFPWNSGTYEFENVAPGRRTLSLALPARCTSATVTVEALAGQVVDATLETTCAPFYGFVRVQLRVEGPPPSTTFYVADVTDCYLYDCDGYIVSAAEPVTLSLLPGPRDLRLFGGSANCTVLTPQPVTVLVESGLTRDLELIVSCS